MTIELQGKATISMLIDGETVIVEVDGDNAPITAGNFVDLVDRGVYENTRFHRVVRDPEPFVVQGGDPQSQDPDIPFQAYGTGGFIDPVTGERRNIPLEIKPLGASEPFYNQTLPVGLEPELKHEQGVIAMARAQEPDTASTQFYFTLQELSFLDGNYAVFGRVLEGFEVIDSVEAISPQDDLEQSEFLEQAAILSEVEVIDIESMLITGTSEVDTLNGTSFRDRIDGFEGDDVLQGLSGRDTILGGPGEDIIRGGPRGDRIFGGSGDDTLNGGGGDDYLDGSSGRNRLIAEDGNDTLIGAINNHRLSGGEGRDSFVFDNFEDENLADSTRDRIEDFEPDLDQLLLALADVDTDFTPGTLPEEQLNLVPTASRSGSRLVYSEGILSYQPNGNDSLTEIAFLEGRPEISAADIVII